MAGEPSPFEPAILELDLENRIVSASARFGAELGCTPESVVGRSLDELFSPDDQTGAMQFALQLRRGRAIDVLISLRVGDGDQLVRLRRARVGDGYHAAVEKVREQDTLYRMFGYQRRWKSLLQATDDGIAVLDAAGHIVEHNDAFAALVPLVDSRGMPLRAASFGEVLLADAIEGSVPALARYLRTHEGVFEVTTKVANVPVEITAHSLLLPNRSRIGTFVQIRDIREELHVRERDQLIEAELARAQAFQRTLLSEPPKVTHYDIELVYRPLDRVGGDMYDIAMLPAEVVRIFIADATGHGVSAALVTMFIKSAYESVKYTLGGPAAVLEALNDRISTTYRSFEAIFTALVIDVACNSHEIEYANAGHPPPLVVDRNGITELEFGGTVIGAQAFRTFPRWTQRLDPDSSIYLVTDGIVEARRDSNDLFGDARLATILQEADRDPTSAPDAVVAHLEHWLRPSAPNDDITLIALRPKTRRSRLAG